MFTEYRDTQRWLHERLIGGGIPAERIAQLYGGQDADEREHIKAVFQEHRDLDPVRILLATDAASEGINLQAHCHRLLHWEIPWNPNRLEQRNGRIDRHGQHAARGGRAPLRPGRLAGRGRGGGSSLEDELDFLLRGREEGRADPGGPGQRR